MIIVPYATLEPTRLLAASAQPQAPVVADDSPSAIVTLWRRLIRHA
jgi:hypothetical protein